MRPHNTEIDVVGRIMSAAPPQQEEDGEPAQDSWVSAFWCFFYGCGIIGTLVVYGLLQERIMTVAYGGELFGISAFLVLWNRCANCIFASVLTASNGESFRAKAPLWKYIVVSLSNVAATTCQYEALKYVSFPVQMLGKSFKMMPVMIWGIIISSKSYAWMDWLIAAAVTAGVTEFLLTGPTSSPNEDTDSFQGFILLVAFLVFDGLTSTMQEKMFKEHATTKYNQMFYVNACSIMVSLVSLIVTGNLIPALTFCGAHGSFVYDAFLLSISAVSSQFFIYSQIKEFGALIFAATMNVRQVVSIIVSYINFGHSITGLQVLGLLTVFGALFFKSYRSMASDAPRKPKSKRVGEYDGQQLIVSDGNIMKDAQV